MTRRYDLRAHRFALRCLLIALVAVVATDAHAQTQQWIKGVGGRGTEFGRFVEPTSDGGFAVGGTRSATAGSSTEQFWIARFDSTGRLLWEKAYGEVGVLHTIFTFSSTRDGGFMVGGFTGQQFSGTESALMFRVDSAGEFMWKYDVNYSDSDHWHLLIDRANGGYYFGGHTDSKDDPTGDMWLVRLDDERQTVWEKTYDRATPEHAHAGIETRDGHLVMLGHTMEGGLEKYWVVKVDSLGTVIWQKVVSSGPTGHDSPYDIFETQEGNYGLVGGTSGTPTPNASQGWFVVLDTAGNEIIDKHFGPVGAQTFTWGGRPTSDGGYILAGHTNYRTKGSLDMYIVKTDGDGEIEWEQTYGGTGLDYGFDVVETNGGYIGVGITSSFGIVTGGEEDVLLVRITEDVDLPAAVQLVSPSNNATGVARAPELRWTPITDAVRYHVQVATDAAFSVLQFEDTSVTTASLATTLAQIGADGRYFWRVRARNDGGWGPFSAAWSFTVGPTSSVAIAGGALRNAVVANPNPAVDAVTLQLELERGGDVVVALYDVRGELVRTLLSETLTPGARTLGVTTSDLDPGTYFVRITRDARQVAATRLTVTR
jgi:hypothetical protein